MRLTNVVLIAALVLAVWSCGQGVETDTGWVEGNVRDSITAVPLSGAEVAISGLRTATDSAGDYTLKNVYTGTWTITVSMDGYRDYSAQVTVTKDAATLLDIELTSNDAHTIGGSVGGLNDTLVLQNNGGDDLNVTEDGTFAFETPVMSGESYTVTIKEQPSGQTCTLSGESGVVGSGDVTDIVVTCDATRYKIGGTVSGLSGSIALYNNGTDGMTITSNGAFEFSAPVASGGTYAVTIGGPQPSGLACAVGGAGGFAESDITGVNVSCIASADIPADMVYVPAGCYLMGDRMDGTTYYYSNQKHRVCISAFFMDKYEVTRGEYSALIGNDPSYGRGFVNPDNYSVNSVMWQEADAYCNLVGKRLPTEAEWEYAARSGGKNHRWAGTDDESEIGKYAWYQDTGDFMWQEVGLLEPNDLGLYDMSGNVWEWVSDWSADYLADEQTDPTGPGTGTYKILRGGAFSSEAYEIKTTHREATTTRWAASPQGMRCARDSL